MVYDIKINEPKETNIDFRYLLGTEGSNPLFVIGVNPSRADEKKPDLTITKVMRFATNHGFDSFIMLNLYPQRTPYPNDLCLNIDTNLHNTNISHILNVIGTRTDVSILASWGGTIRVRKYLKECLNDIFIKTKDRNIKWLKIGEPTVSGHPRHPSRAPYEPFTNFDIEAYLKRI